MSIWNELEYFSRSEFDYPDEISPDLLYGLEDLRKELNQPIYITSDYRPDDSRSHGRGLAVDIADDLDHDAISSNWRFRVVQTALRVGFRRIGVYDKHIHLDIDSSLPQDVLWVGMSQ